MNITRAAIEKNRITIVALVAIVLAGFSAFGKMPRAEDPGFTMRAAMVATYFPGASPERVEQLVTDKLEKVIMEMPELKFVESVSKTGVSVIYVIVKERYRKMRPIWDSLRRKVEKGSSGLPEGVIGPFVNDEFGDVFGTILTVTGEGYTYAEMKDVADEVREELLLIDEVAKVDIYGAQEERVFVEYNNARLAELGISPYQIQQILLARNIIIPGGEIDTGEEVIALEPSGNFESILDLKRTVVKLPGKSELLHLEDVVNIRRGYIDPPKYKVRSSGESALALAINLREGGNIMVLGEKVREMVRRLQELYPIGVDFDFVAFQADHVDKRVKNFIRNLLQAVAVVVAVMLLTLGFRTGLVVASLIPMAIISTLLIMYYLNIGLDTMSLASLIIVLGMLVDNAIVMSESISVQISEGKKPVDAAVDSAAELRVPLLTSSLTTAVAFLPIFLAKSGTGEYCAPLFKVVTIALMSSWVLSLTMTPMLCVYFLKVRSNPEKSSFDSRFYRFYRGFLLRILRYPLLSVAVTVVVFLTVMQGFRFIPKIFFPPNDKPVFTAEFTFPLGTPIEKTEAAIAIIEPFIAEELTATSDRLEGITNWATFIGGGAPRFTLNYSPGPSNPEYAVILANTTSRAVIDELVPKIEGFCLERFPDMRAVVRPLFFGDSVDAPVGVRVMGRDQDVLFSIVDRIKAKLYEVPGTKNIRDSWGMRTKKLLVKVNEERARRAGLTSRDIAISLQTILSGLETTQYREDDKVIPVTLRSVAADREDIGKLESHNIYVQQTGQSVPLKQVADLEIAWQPSKILRRDRLNTVTVMSNLAPGVTPFEVSGALKEWLEEDRKSWGVGYKYGIGGEMENSGDANASIAEQLPIAFFIILILLVGQFNSIRRPIIILSIIPLSLMGVVIGLIVARSYFGFMTFLGVISLAGIVINNAIVLLDRIRFEIDQNGLEPARAIIESAQRRMRPILLTTATTIGGLTPLWLGGGIMWEPMAVAIIFGLGFATILTLGVVPVLYALFFRVKFKGFVY